MTLALQRLDADVSVAPQLGPEAMAEAKAAGFRSIINNRPDLEAGPSQPTNASVEAAARVAGLEYVYLPVAPGFQSAEEIARFRELIDTMPKPILAFCRSGTRSGKLWHAATGR